MDKKILGIAAIIAVIAVAAFGIFSAVPLLPLAQAQSKETVKIGVVVPMTGSQAEYGQGIREGLELALSEINQNPAYDFKIVLIYEDNAGDVKSSVSAAQKLIGVDKVAAIISGVSQHSLAVAPIAEENKVVLYTMASQTSALNGAGDFVFKNDDDLVTLGTAAARMIFGAGHRKVAILFSEYNDATVDAKNSFVEKFSKLGGEVVAVEGFQKGTTDFRTSLAKIKGSGATALFLNPIMGDCVPILKQIKELGLQQTLYANGTIESQEVIDGAGDAAEGIIFITFQGLPSDSFVQKSEAAYGHYPKRWAVEAYDGLHIIAAALSKMKGSAITSASLQGALVEVRAYIGESGDIEFDAQGNARRELFVKQIKGGKFVLLD